MDLNAQWVVGFVDGEGCFHIGINTNKEMTLGVQVLPEFTVVQHEMDEQVLHGLKEYFGCGVVRKNHGKIKSYRVRGHQNLLTKIIPFFVVVVGFKDSLYTLCQNIIPVRLCLLHYYLLMAVYNGAIHSAV